MGTVVIWGLAIIGGVGVIIIGLVVFVALSADKAQRDGNNWFR